MKSVYVILEASGVLKTRFLKSVVTKVTVIRSDMKPEKYDKLKSRLGSKVLTKYHPSCSSSLAFI